MSRKLGAVGSGDDARPAVVTTLGVSGYLMDSDVLLWDRASQSLWSQVGMRAIAGPRSGQELTMLPISDTTWAAWKKAHPETQVLRAPGNPARYAAGPYDRYLESDRLMFPVRERSDVLRNKAIVTGAEVDGVQVAWSHERLAETAESRAEEERDQSLVSLQPVGETTLRLTYDPEADSVVLHRRGDAGWERVPAHRMFWFAWYAFHPDTDLRPDAGGPDEAE